MKLTKYILTLILIISGATLLFSQESYNASVSYKLESIKKDTINRNIFGGFTEFLNDYINGPMGLWAQEFKDRGFDYTWEDSSRVSFHWEHWNKDNVQDSVALETNEKYNENGLFSQLIQNKSGGGETGIRQRILISDTITHSFYIYAKSTGIPLNIQFLDTNENVIYEEAIVTDSVWKKYELDIPQINNNNLWVYFSIKEQGTIYLDESSLVPDNNELGIRQEYADIFRKWNPTVMRFPGGSFVSNIGGEWWSGIDFLDKRKSPIKYGAIPVNQRMDMGYIEYFEMCEKFGFSTYIVSAYLRHSYQDHMNFLEFLMGDEETEFGSLRAKYGHPKPFKVDFYEFGNEQWDIHIEYAQKFKIIYDMIKAKYPELRVIAAGNHWSGKSFVTDQMNIIKNSIDVYGFHPAKPDLVNDDLPDSLNFLSIVGLPYYTADSDIKNIYNNCKIYNSDTKFRVGITEWWGHYGDFRTWTLDTHWRNNSLEIGLWDTGMMLGFMKRSDVIELTNRTLGMSWINRKVDKNTGKKAIFPSVGLKSAIFLNSHHGKLPIPVEIDSPKFNINEDSIAYHFETKYLDASCTYDGDSIYFYFINRSPSRRMNVSTDINAKFGENLKAKKYVLTSNYFLDHVTAENQNSIGFTDEDVILNDVLLLEPFTFTTFVIANKSLSTIDVQDNTNGKTKSIIIKDLLYLDKEKLFEKISVHNLNGKLIFETDLLKGQELINMSSLPNGFYSIILSGNSEKYPFLIYKEK